MDQSGSQRRRNGAQTGPTPTPTGTPQDASAFRTPSFCGGQRSRPPNGSQCLRGRGVSRPRLWRVWNYESRWHEVFFERRGYVFLDGPIRSKGKEHPQPVGRADLSIRKTRVDFIVFRSHEENHLQESLLFKPDPGDDGQRNSDRTGRA